MGRKVSCIFSLLHANRSVARVVLPRLLQCKGGKCISCQSAYSIGGTDLLIDLWWIVRVIRISLPILYRSGHLGPEQSTYGSIHSVKGRTSAPISLHMWYRGGWTYKWVVLQGRGEEWWLAWITRLGPTHKKCGWALDSDVQQGFDLSWVQVITSAECKKVSG
jgi:hypothetical protein